MENSYSLKDIFGRGLYDFSQTFGLTSSPNDSNKVALRLVDLSEGQLVSQGRYIRPYFVMFNNGSIIPAYVGFNHLGPKVNTIEFLFLVTPLGLSNTDKADLNKHNIILQNPSIVHIFSDFASNTSNAAFKYFYLGSNSNSGIQTDVPLSPAYDDFEGSNIIDLAIRFDTPVDLNFNFLSTYANPIEFLVNRVETMPDKDFDIIESYCLLKFKNAVQALGTFHKELDSNRIFGLSVFHNYISIPLDESNLDDLFDENEITKLCPVGVYSFDINKEKRTINLVHEIDIDAELFQKIISDSPELDEENFNSDEFSNVN